MQKLTSLSSKLWIWGIMGLLNSSSCSSEEPSKEEKERTSSLSEKKERENFQLGIFILLFSWQAARKLVQGDRCKQDQCTLENAIDHLTQNLYILPQIDRQTKHCLSLSHLTAIYWINDEVIYWLSILQRSS